MRVDFGLVLCIVLQYILFIYYADTLFYRKREKFLCYGVTALGYAIHGVVCVFGNVPVNTAVFIGVNFLCLIFCYHIDWKNAIFQSTMLMILSGASEWLVIYLPYFGMPADPLMFTPTQSLILTLLSMMLYLIEIMIVSHLLNAAKYANYTPAAAMISIPAISILIIVLIIKLNINSNLLSLVCLLIIVINVIVFAVNQLMIRKELENAELRRQLVKENIDYEEYMLLKEKHEQTRMFHHDFKEHMNTLCTLMGEGSEKARDYIKSITREEEDLRLTEYTDNKILNILLAKKKTECKEKDINLSIDTSRAHVDFISDMDTVTIFSNLINNAVESCLRSNEKKIFLTIGTENENFAVIKLENTADKKPVVINRRLRTHKDNDKMHGIGMNSIRRALKNYDGNLSWSYDASEKIFRTTIVIKNPAVKMTVRA